MNKVRILYNRDDKYLKVTIIYYTIMNNPTDKIVIKEIKTFKNRKYISYVKEILNSVDNLCVECVIGVSDVITSTTSKLSEDKMFDKMIDTVSFDNHEMYIFQVVEFNNSTFYTYGYVSNSILNEIEILKKELNISEIATITDIDLCFLNIRYFNNDDIMDYAVVYRKDDNKIFVFIVNNKTYCRIMMVDINNLKKLLKEFNIEYCAFININNIFDIKNRLRLFVKYSVVKDDNSVISSNRIFLYITENINQDIKQKVNDDIENYRLLKDSINYENNVNSNKIKKKFITMFLLLVILLIVIVWIVNGSGFNVILNKITGMAGMTTEEQVSKEHRIAYDKVLNSIEETGITVNGSYLRDNIMYVIIDTDKNTSMLSDVMSILDNNGYDTDMYYDEDENIVINFQLY